MPYADHEIQLEAQRRHYQTNRERYLENQRRRRSQPGYRENEYAKRRKRDHELREQGIDPRTKKPRKKRPRRPEVDRTLQARLKAETMARMGIEVEELGSNAPPAGIGHERGEAATKDSARPAAEPSMPTPEEAQALGEAVAGDLRQADRDLAEGRAVELTDELIESLPERPQGIPEWEHKAAMRVAANRRKEVRAAVAPQETAGSTLREDMTVVVPGDYVPALLLAEWASGEWTLLSATNDGEKVEVRLTRERSVILP